MLSGLATWVQDVIESLGYLGVAILVIVENLFPPIPSEIVLPFAGFVAQRGDASVVVMILAATIGSVVGAHIDQRAPLLLNVGQTTLPRE